MLAGLVALLIAGDPSLASAPSPDALLGAQEVPACGWPNVVAVAGRCTGTLIHPRVVVFAAHCGGAETIAFTENDVDGPKREVTTRYCGQFPRAEGELGRDFAYCVLDEPQLDVPIVPPLMGCERDQLVVGSEVTVVGFGIDAAGIGGIKRQLVLTVGSFANDEVFISGNGDACIGDSGGPAFVRVADPSGGPDTWRVFGIVSHGDLECIDGTHYGRMDVGMAWFEESTDFDLTPCGDPSGAWSPDPRCHAFPTDVADLDGQWPTGCSAPGRGADVSTCGPAIGPVSDDEPPTVAIDSPEGDGEYDSDPDTMLADLEIEVSVGDAFAVAEVTLRIDGEPVPSGIQGLPPYRFSAGFPAGLYTVDAVATDYAGNVGIADPILVAVDEALPRDEDDPGCACGRAPGVSPWLWVWLFAVPRRRRLQQA